MKDKNNLEPSDYTSGVPNTLNEPEIKAFENVVREAGTPYFSTLYDIDMWSNDLKTIHTALERYVMLKKMKLLPYPKSDQEYRMDVIKRLLAFEIIKEKHVDVNELTNFIKLEFYNEYVVACDDDNERVLTQEEWDLLREML